jgi:D-aminopeptidase
MMPLPKGPKNSLTDVPGVRVSHLTRIAPDGDRPPVRTGLTAIFTRPSSGQHMRPAAAVTVGGMVELTGLCVLDDFGFLMTPVVATSLRAVGCVHDAMVGQRYAMDLGWPPVIAGFNDARLGAGPTPAFTEREVADALAKATDARVEEGAVGAATGLVAFGFKSGIGSASRVIGAGEREYTVGALTVLNLGRPEALAVQGAPRRDAGGSAHPQGSALIVLATDAPFEDRQCRQIASAGLMGLARLGAAPGGSDTLIAIAVSTGILLSRNDRARPALDVPVAADAITSLAAQAALEAAEEAAVRSLTQVAERDATTDYPVLRIGA